MNTDTMDQIVEGILKGKSLNVRVSGLESERLNDWRARLQEFGKLCGNGRHRINCNTMTNQKGDERIEVNLGVIPEEIRHSLADALRSMYNKDSPKIKIALF